ncbi:MAG: class I SAM-dependent methyltransferase [Gemmatimonadaceae bacterium]
MPSEVDSPYTTDFYAGQSGDSYLGAMGVLPRVFDLVKPASVVDVGCGVGTWLAAALELGAKRAVGLEGAWVTPAQLRDPRVELITTDLERPIAVDGRFDLAMSLEVAEHVSAGRASALVAEIARLAPAVLFGAAIPHQGGAFNHVNEQWQSYWIEKFASVGFRALDVVRPALWRQREIPVHYRQNPFLYVSEERWAELSPKVPTSTMPSDVVHPEVHLAQAAALHAPPTLGKALGTLAQLPAIVGRSLSHRLGGTSGRSPK